MGFFSALCLILIALKLTGYIAWSWWSVILVPLGIWMLLVTIVFFSAASLMAPKRKK